MERQRGLGIELGVTYGTLSFYGSKTGEMRHKDMCIDIRLMLYHVLS